MDKGALPFGFARQLSTTTNARKIYRQRRDVFCRRKAVITVTNERFVALEAATPDFNRSCCDISRGHWLITPSNFRLDHQVTYTIFSLNGIFLSNWYNNIYILPIYLIYYIHKWIQKRSIWTVTFVIRKHKILVISFLWSLSLLWFLNLFWSFFEVCTKLRKDRFNSSQWIVIIMIVSVSVGNLCEH